jgi:O-antigen/teichoic acid export membrane protein
LLICEVLVSDKAFNIRKSTIKSTFWNYVSHYIGKVLLFITTIILARILLKDDFGVAGYALTVIGFLDVIGDLGLATAIIYYKDDSEAKDTAFWLGICVGILFGAGTFLMAPLVGAFYQDQRAVPLTQALALLFPLSALKNIHEALLRKGLAFGKKIIPDLIQTVSKGIISILLAFLGYGAWSLVLGPLVGTAVSVIAFWLVCSWRPSLRFSVKWLRPLVSYGSGIIGVNLLAAIAMNIDYIFVGRYLGTTALGVYMLAFRVPELIILQFCSVLSRVMLPVYAHVRDEIGAMQRGFLTTTRYVSLVTIPMGVGLSLLSDPFIRIFFGDRWAEAIPVMQAISIYAMLLSLAYHAGDVYKAQGSPNLVSLIVIVRIAVLLPCIWWAVTYPASIVAVAWMQVCVAIIGSGLNMIIATRRLNIPLSTIIADLWPTAVGSIAMGIVVFLANQLLVMVPRTVSLAVCIVLGMAVYTLALWWLQRDIVLRTTDVLRSAFARG